MSNDVIQTLQSLINGLQNKRILRLSFPHVDGPQAQLLVNKLDGVESLSRDFGYTVELLSDGAELALKDLQGNPTFLTNDDHHLSHSVALQPWQRAARCARSGLQLQ